MKTMAAVFIYIIVLFTCSYLGQEINELLLGLCNDLGMGQF